MILRKEIGSSSSSGSSSSTTNDDSLAEQLFDTMSILLLRSGSNCIPALTSGEKQKMEKDEDHNDEVSIIQKRMENVCIAYMEHCS